MTIGFYQFVKRKATSDITTLVSCELLSTEDECLQENDLKFNNVPI